MTKTRNTTKSREQDTSSLTAKQTREMIAKIRKLEVMVGACREALAPVSTLHGGCSTMELMEQKIAEIDKENEEAAQAEEQAAIQEQLCSRMAQDADPEGVVSLVARMLSLMKPYERAQFKRRLRAMLDRH